MEPRDGSRANGGQRLAGPFLRVYTPEGKKPCPDNAVIASVLYYRNGAYTVVRPDDRPEHHGRPPLMARPYSAVDVAMGKHRSSFAMQLPAAGGAAFFQTEVDVTWEVVDPYLVARARVVNVADLIGPELQDRLRDVSRRFAVTEAAQAYDAIQERMRSGEWQPLGSDIGLETRVYVRVDLSERAIGVVQADEDEDHAEARVRKRKSYFQDLIEAGDYAQFADAIARNPDEAQTILQMLKDERRADRQEGLDFVLHMIDQGLIEPHHVSEHVRAVIDYVRRSSGRLLALDPSRPVRPGRPRLEGRPRQRGAPQATTKDADPWDQPAPSAAEPWEVPPPADRRSEQPGADQRLREPGAGRSSAQDGGLWSDGLDWGDS